MRNIYIGIDPGLKGAVAFTNGEHTWVSDTPTVLVKSGKKNKNVYVVFSMVAVVKEGVNRMGGDIGGVRVAIEKQQSMPGQGVASMFSIGYGFGLWEGIISAMGFPYTLVTPKSWKKMMMEGMGKEKAASCVRAQQLFPKVDLFTPRGRALDGRGDALLIMEYLKRTS